MIGLKKFRKYTEFTGFQVTADMLNEKGLATIRGFIKNIAQVELFPPKIIVSTRSIRLIIAPTDWLLQCEDGRYYCLRDEDLLKVYELIDEQNG
jgi:hypothetical protein